MVYTVKLSSPLKMDLNAFRISQAENRPTYASTASPYSKSPCLHKNDVQSADLLMVTVIVLDLCQTWLRYSATYIRKAFTYTYINEFNSYRLQYQTSELSD